MMSLGKVVLQQKVLLRFYLQYARYLKYCSFSAQIENKGSRRLILLISHDMNRSGAPLLLLHIAKCLHARGFEVITVSKCAGSLVPPFAEVSKVIICREVRFFERHLRKMVEQNLAKALVNSAISGDWVEPLRRSGFDVVSLIHEMPGSITSWGGLADTRKMIAFSSALVFPAEIVRQRIEEMCGVPVNGHILPQGLYLKPTARTDRLVAKDLINERYSLSRKKSVLNVATGNIRKGFDFFVEMAAVSPDIDFLWVGDIDRDIVRKVKRKHSLKKMTNLHLLGYVSDKDLLFALYAAADVFALTSREEPFGSIILEAMYAGTPIVAFKDAGGFQGTLEKSGAGLLAEHGDWRGMLERITYLVRDDCEHSRVSRNAVAAIEQFDFDNYVTSIVDLFSPK